MNRLTPSERRLGAILCNAVLVSMQSVGLVMSTISAGWGQFQYYTQDSNYFSMIVSVLFLLTVCRPANRGKPLPEWLAVCRFIATCLLTVTFTVIVFILSPPYGWAGFRFTLFTGENTFFHLLCPVLSFVSFFLFEDRPRAKHVPLLALIPTLVYAAVSVILNVARVWSGPYDFLLVYKNPVWLSVVYAVVIVGGAYLAAFLLDLAKRRQKK